LTQLTNTTLARIKSPIGVLLIIYCVLGILYSVIIPPYEASDELWHYPTVQYLATHGLQLPPQEPGVVTAWRQEGSQPPLYYMLGGLLTSWIDTSDMVQARKLNPHADIGIIVPDGNVNMVVHDPTVEGFPYRGSTLALHLVRLLSVLLGAITVAMTYGLTTELFPNNAYLALTAAVLTAFNPMFLFISGSVNNDNLSNALGATLLVLVVRLIKRTSAPTIRDLILIGVITGAGLIAKFNIGFLIPLIALSLAVIAYRLRNWRPFVIGAVITGGLTILIAGWWYLRNIQLYGDPTGLNRFLDIVGRRPVPANLPQLWSERHTFLMSYWGFFGGVNVPMPEIIYLVFNTIAAISVIGLIIGLVRRNAQSLDWSIQLGRLFTIIWIAVLFVSLLRWTSETWASQGRLMFSAISPLSMWMAVGLWSLPFRRTLIVSVVIWFAIVAVVIAPLTLYVAYQPSNYVRTASICNSQPCSEVTFAEPLTSTQPALTLAFKPFAASVEVGQYFQLDTVRFTTRSRFTRDWSAFIHVENADGLIVTQRDVYLQQGLAATTLLIPYNSWDNRFAIRMPDFAVAPQTLNVYLGFYDLVQPQDRLVVQGNSSIVDNRVLLGTLKLQPRSSALNLPNPMQVNFGGEAELVGYDVSQLGLVPGQKVTITFYWRALRPITVDYHIFTQVLIPGTTITFGGNDATLLTSTWKPGEIVKDEHTFRIDPNTPPGIWQVQVGIYELAPNNQFKRLRIITLDGGEAEAIALLTRIKIGAKPEAF
jgi:4-amino-4-deoxy-L-arabinose transferase-like glycosyltransferase